MSRPPPTCRPRPARSRACGDASTRRSAPRFAGWGATWVDFANSGTPDLLLAAGAIPVTNLAADAEAVRVLAPVTGARAFGNAKGVIAAKGMRLNGRGVAAADVANDGRMDIAINTIGGKLVLLHPTGPSRALARRASCPASPRARSSPPFSRTGSA